MIDSTLEGWEGVPTTNVSFIGGNGSDKDKRQSTTQYSSFCPTVEKILTDIDYFCIVLCRSVEHTFDRFDERSGCLILRQLYRLEGMTKGLPFYVNYVDRRE